MSDTVTAEAPAAPASTGLEAMHAMRARRKRNRLGDLEWFDAAYKVYVVGLFGGIALAWLSDLVGDEVVSAAGEADVARHGPAVLGLLAVLAVAAGLRGGSQGGPLALEAAAGHAHVAPRVADGHGAHDLRRHIDVGLDVEEMAQIDGHHGFFSFRIRPHARQ